MNKQFMINLNEGDRVEVSAWNEFGKNYFGIVRRFSRTKPKEVSVSELVKTLQEKYPNAKYFKVAVFNDIKVHYLEWLKPLGGRLIPYTLDRAINAEKSNG